MHLRNAKKLILEAKALLDAAATPADIEFGEPQVTAAAAFKMFLDAAKTIWKSDLLDDVKFDYQVVPNKKGTAAAALAYMLQPLERRRMRAIGDHLLRVPSSKAFTLRLREDILNKDADFVRKIMIHEAVHIGHSDHNESFERVVKKYHGAVSEYAAETDSKVIVLAQPAPKKRYKQIEPHSESTFDSIEDARTYARAYHKRTGLSVQLRY